MEETLHAIKIFTIASFTFYGFLCLETAHMKSEFERYGLGKYQKLTGLLQLLGAAGLLVGYWFQPTAILASLGLGVLMIFGFLTRIKIRDPWLLCLPALAYAFLSFFILWMEIIDFLHR